MIEVPTRSGVGVTAQVNAKTPDPVLVWPNKRDVLSFIFFAVMTVLFWSAYRHSHPAPADTVEESAR